MIKQINVDWSRDANEGDLGTAMRRYMGYLKDLGFRKKLSNLAYIGHASIWNLPRPISLQPKIFLGFVKCFKERGYQGRL